MTKFNLKTFANYRKCDLNELKNWLQFNGYDFSFEKSIRIPINNLKLLIEVAEHGIRTQFQPSLAEREKNDLHHKWRSLSVEVAKILAALKNESGKITSIEKKVKQEKQFKILCDDIAHTESQYKKINEEYKLSNNP